MVLNYLDQRKSNYVYFKTALGKNKEKIDGWSNVLLNSCMTNGCRDVRSFIPDSSLRCFASSIISCMNLMPSSASVWDSAYPQQTKSNICSMQNCSEYCLSVVVSLDDLSSARWHNTGSRLGLTSLKLLSYSTMKMGKSAILTFAGGILDGLI